MTVFIIITSSPYFILAFFFLTLYIAFEIMVILTILLGYPFLLYKFKIFDISKSLYKFVGNYLFD